MIYEIMKTLVLSTCHLTEATCNGFKGDLFVADHEYGVYFYVPTDADMQDYEIPDDLRAVIAFAQDMGVREVKFDCDAATVDNLPTYEW